MVLSKRSVILVCTINYIGFGVNKHSEKGAIFYIKFDSISDHDEAVDRLRVTGIITETDNEMKSRKNLSSTTRPAMKKPRINRSIL